MELLSQLREILLQLGANETAFIQFFIFIVAISFLTFFVYGPYFKACDQRLKQTKGADQVATETQEEAKKIESIFQVRAREINEKIKNIFDASRAEAVTTATNVINQSKLSAAGLTEKALKEIGAEKTNAEKDIQNISQSVAAEISKKLTGAV